MTDLKKMTVAASGKLRQVAYDILNEQTRLLSWQQGGTGGCCCRSCVRADFR